jgi:hypothetical protein
MSWLTAATWWEVRMNIEVTGPVVGESGFWKGS